MGAKATVTDGVIEAPIEIAASPERVFRALSTPEVAEWWGAPELYHVDKWTGDLRVGGTWQADTVSAQGGPPMIVRGTYRVVDPPRVLEHTWEPSWDHWARTIVRYELTPTPAGTLVRVRHSGFAEAATTKDHAEGWLRVLGWLATHFALPR